MWTTGSLHADCRRFRDGLFPYSSRILLASYGVVRVSRGSLLTTRQGAPVTLRVSWASWAQARQLLWVEALVLVQ